MNIEAIKAEEASLSDRLWDMPPDAPLFAEMYAARQALAWALEPALAASPLVQIERHHAEPGDK